MKNTTVQLIASLYEVNLICNATTAEVSECFANASRKHADHLRTCRSQHWKMGDRCQIFACKIVIGNLHG